MSKNRIISIILALLVCFFCFASCDSAEGIGDEKDKPGYSQNEGELTDTKESETAYASEEVAEEEKVLLLSDIPEFSGKAFVAINGNEPDFSSTELTTESFESYDGLDYLGRCGVAFACLGRDLMPLEERGNIGQVKPSGWHTVKYDCVDGKYLYNRCHLIGFQLSGENANERNLITGTRYMNVEGMLPFENMVADYIKETDNHVMYRVTPVYDRSNLVATGVQMEAYSVEDEGEGICFNVFCYNSQPGVEIDYLTGDSRLSEGSAPKETEEGEPLEYVLNTGSRKFHYPSCRSVKNMADGNKSEFKGTRGALIDKGYSPCGVCHP